MRRSRRAVPGIAILVAMVLAGCGGGGSGSTAKSTPAGTDVKAAVAECHQLVAKQTKLPANVKAKLADACDKAGKGDTEAVKRVAREVCEELVTRVSLSSSARAQALAACKK